MASMTKISADLDQPILFRTGSADVARQALTVGSIRLGSSAHYREIEDKVRRDKSEGMNGTPMGFEARFEFGGCEVKIRDDGMLKGRIGVEVPPHYIFSLHGLGISSAQRESFGGNTFGVKNIAALAEEVAARAAKIVPVTSWKFGQACYQYTALNISRDSLSAAVRFPGTPSTYLKANEWSAFRKEPILPFIEQDEWRIVVFTEARASKDAPATLHLRVNPAHFYEYEWADREKIAPQT